MPSLESIEAHGSFIATILLVIFAMLAYFRPPQPRNLDAMDSLSAPTTRATVGFFHRVPPRTLIAAGLAIIFGMYTFYAMDKLGSVPGPAGPQGMQAPVGPQGPPGPAMTDPRVDGLIQRLSALEHSEKQTSQMIKFQVCLQQLKSEALSKDDINKLLEGAQDEVLHPDKCFGPALGRMQCPLERWNAKIDRIVSISKLCYPNRIDIHEKNIHNELPPSQMEQGAERAGNGRYRSDEAVPTFFLSISERVIIYRPVPI
jgi:hypothetical protein